METIDALRDLLGLNDRDAVAFTTLSGYMEIPDPDTHEMTWKTVRTGDTAFVFVGPEDKLNGILRVDKEKETVTFEVTFPAPESLLKQAAKAGK